MNPSSLFRLRRRETTSITQNPRSEEALGQALQRLLLVLAALALVLLSTGTLVGCSRKKPPPTPTPTTGSGPEPTATVERQEPKSIAVLIADEVTTLDPYRMVSFHPEGSIAYHLWDTLTVLNDDLEVEAHLARSWRLINNFTWEISLRQGIAFHNGEPLDAEAVRFSVERSMAPDSLETFAEDIALQRVEIVDQYTVRFVTRRPVSNMVYHLSTLEILPPTYYTETDPDQLALAPVGSGPYQVSEFVPGERLVLEAVPTYWKGAPTWSTVVFETIPDVADRLQALGDAEAALATDLPPTRPDEWEVAGSRLEAIESTQRMLVGIHATAGSPLASVGVRQALNYGIDVEPIVQEWLKGYGTRYGSYVNPPDENAQLEPWPTDLDRAAQLLAEAGYPVGFATTMLVPQGAYYESEGLAEAIAAQWAQLGVTVEVEVVNWDAYAKRLLSANPPPLFLLALNSRGDPLQDTKNLSADFRFNPTGWQNDAFEDAIERAQNSFNKNARLRALNEAQSIAYKEAPWIWLWRQYRFYGVTQQLEWTPRRDGLVHVYGLRAQGTEN